MKSYEFSVAGVAKIDGKSYIVRRYDHGAWFKIGRHKLRADSFDEAVEKFKRLVLGHGRAGCNPVI
jgi:hypothetical protein